MATPSTSPTQVAHKRKRAWVSYYESDGEVNSVYASDESTDESTDDYSAVRVSIVPHITAYGPSITLQTPSHTVYQKPKKPKKPSPSSKKRSSISERPVKLSLFPLLSLPAELRNLIYTSSLTDSEPLTLVHKVHTFRHVAVRSVVSCAHPLYLQGYFRGTARNRYYTTMASGGPQCPEPDPAFMTPRKLSPALLATNHQIHSEASPLLYGRTVCCEDTMTLHAFLAQIGLANQALLRDIVIAHWGNRREAARTMNYPAMTLLVGAVNLQRLAIGSTLGSRFGLYHYAPNSGEYGEKGEHLKNLNARRLARHFLQSGGYWLEAVARAKGKRDAGVGVISLVPENFGLLGEDAGSDQTEVEMQRFRRELRRLLK